MSLFSQNIKNLFGKQGETWLTRLPELVELLAAHWNLRELRPVSNMTFHYVAKAKTMHNQAVVLKVACTAESIREEMQALIYFNGRGSIKLIDHDDQYHALLLEQALPGDTLKSLYPAQVEYVMTCYVATMNKLHQAQLADHNFRHISAWLKTLDQLRSNQIPTPVLARAIQMRDDLLASMGPLVFLHGDLHHDNILKQDQEWLAIDPKGIVGEREFEIAAFDFMYIPELATQTDAKMIFEKRIKLLAQKASLDEERIKAWVFVRLVLMAAWSIEDKSDPRWAIQVAELLI